MKSLRTRVLPLGLLVSFTSLVLTSVSEAKWANLSEPVPVQRLLKNVGDYIKAHPQEGKGYYTLGRIHSLAFAAGTETVSVQNNKTDPSSTLPGFPSYESVMIRKHTETRALSKEARKHLVESVRNYQRATQLSPNEGLYFLGLGWMLEQGSDYAPEVGLPPGEKARKLSALQKTRFWQSKAIAAYRKAFALTYQNDLTLERLGPGANPISLEAGEGIMRLLATVTRLDKRKLSRQEKAELARVHQTVDKITSKPRVVTPIIFSLKAEASLDQLLMPDKQVNFDLAGNGQPVQWPWVQPDTCILVWDPNKTGRIVSGRQLFGSVTWWMFWQHGYEPLAALDDNRDGWLGGRELDGIAVWRDGNSNGISEPGEVVSLASLKIEQIAAQSQGKQDGVFYNGTGLRRTDGTFLPTYDWVATPAPHALP